MAALDEMFVGLWVVEAADDGPHGRDWSVDLLDHGGTALVWANWVGMVPGNGFRNRTGDAWL